MKNYGHKRLIAFFVAFSLFFSLSTLSATAVPNTTKLVFEKNTFDTQLFSTTEAYMELGYGKSASLTHQSANTPGILVSDLSINGFGEEVSLKISIDNQQHKILYSV